MTTSRTIAGANEGTPDTSTVRLNRRANINEMDVNDVVQNPENTGREFVNGPAKSSRRRRSPYGKRSRKNSKRRLRTPGKRSKSPRSSRSNNRRKLRNNKKRAGSRRKLQASQANLGVKIFADTLIDMVLFEKDVENSKRAICSQPDFCGEVLVSLVDQTGVGYVDWASFSNFIRDLLSLNVSKPKFAPINDEEIKALYEEIREYTRMEMSDSS
jgi:hypothetical protein